jgi:DNA repair ATPase RecN
MVKTPLRERKRSPACRTSRRTTAVIDEEIARPSICERLDLDPAQLAQLERVTLPETLKRKYGSVAEVIARGAVKERCKRSRSRGRIETIGKRDQSGAPALAAAALRKARHRGPKLVKSVRQTGDLGAVEFEAKTCLTTSLVERNRICRAALSPNPGAPPLRLIASSGEISR